jgi:hypothetical protein
LVNFTTSLHLGALDSGWFYLSVISLSRISSFENFTIAVSSELLPTHDKPFPAYQTVSSLSYYPKVTIKWLLPTLLQLFFQNVSALLAAKGTGEDTGLSVL